jgi:nitrite reductase/ring-hydroxylating ferredoxin subunit
VEEKATMADDVQVARTTEIESGQARLIEVKGKQIALFNVDGQFIALDNRCTHRGVPLAEGELSGHELTCPLRGATFDVRTGDVVGPPAERAVAQYGVRLMGTDIEVEV